MANAPEWKQFEQAVSQFAAALDRTATVKHNVILPDRHTGTPRQRDVWIDAKLMGHFPVSALVSCKRRSQKLDVSDVDAFHGELLSSRAQLGVLYSYSGYTEPAIEKGRELGISCCQLYQGSGPELPRVLSLSSYCCFPQIGVSLFDVHLSDWTTATWGDVFSTPVEGGSGPLQTLDALVAAYHRAERDAIGRTRQDSGFPQSFESETVLALRDGAAPLKVRAFGRWTFYQAKFDVFWVNGSYEFTRGDFKGQFATPSIDRMGPEPGPGWERIEQEPVFKAATILCVLSSGDAKDALLSTAGALVLSVSRA